MSKIPNRDVSSVIQCLRRMLNFGVSRQFNLNKRIFYTKIIFFLERNDSTTSI